MLCNPLVQRPHQRGFLQGALRRLGECIAQALHQLEQRQVGIAQSRAHQMLVAFGVARQHGLQPAEEFWHALGAKFFRGRGRFLFLVLVIQARAYRVVRVVRLVHRVGNRQLDLMRPQAVGNACAHQLEARAQVQQDGGGLPDHSLAVHQQRAGKRRPRHGLVLQVVEQGRQALPVGGVTPRDIHIRRAGRFQRQTDKFAATLDAGPVEELVRHGRL